MKTQHSILFVLAVIGLLFIAGCTQQPTTPPVTSTVTPMATTSAASPVTPPASSPGNSPATVTAEPLQTHVRSGADTIGTAGSTLGKVLTDAKGKTLYYFANDVVGSETSACTGTCADTWPAFSTDTIQVSSPLFLKDFGTSARADGTKQITYNGLRLYTYKADTQTGDVKGENVNKVWFAATPFEYILVAQSPERGSYLTDASGKTLYYFIQDTPGNSTLVGHSLTEFPVFGPRLISTPSSLDPKDFTFVTRADGVSQIAYKGMPLYSYVEDKKPGDTLAQKYSTDFFAANISGVTAVGTLVPPRTMDNPGY